MLVFLTLTLTAIAVTAAAFLIRPRPPRRVVSSLSVWRRVLDEPRTASIWERIRWLVSFALALSIAAAIAVAIAQPLAERSGQPAGRALIVLDSSWTMRARTASGSTRWDKAIDDARAIVDAAPADEIAIATTAEGIVEGPTADRTLIRRALDRVVASGGPDIAWPRVASASATHFLTDGAVRRVTDAGVVVHSVFVPAPNVAVTAFDVQPAADAAGGAEAFIAVANHAAAPQTVDLTITRATNTVFHRSIEIRGGDTHREVLAVPAAGDARFRAQVSARDNALDIDDVRSAWLWTAQPLVVGVVGDKSAVPPLLANDATMRVTAVDPAQYDRATADVWVFDGWLPSTAPGKPALIIDPPASSWLGARGAEEPEPAWRSGLDHAILDGVDVGLGRIGPARPLTRASMQPVAMSDRQTPLVGIEDSASGRYVLVNFTIANTSFASTPAFPILLANAIDWLGRPDRGAVHSPGPLLLTAATRRVIAPNGATLPLVPVHDGVMTTLPAPGLYLTETTFGPRVITVGLDDPARTNLLTSTLAADQSPRRPSRTTGRTWMLATLAALVLASIEWVTWRRRVTV